MATKKEIHQVLARLAAAYPHFQLTEETISIYCEMLEDIPFPELLDAAEKQIKVSTFFPAVAELRRAYDEKRLRIHRQDQERQWRENLEQYKSEALSADESKRMLRRLTAAAGKPSNLALVPVREDIKKVVSEEVGADMTDEEWEQRKQAEKAKVGQ